MKPGNEWLPIFSDSFAKSFKLEIDRVKVTLPLQAIILHSSFKCQEHVQLCYFPWPGPTRQCILWDLDVADNCKESSCPS